MSLVVRGSGLKTMYAVPSATSLSIVEEIPFNEWRDLVVTVADMAERVAWWIGDALAFGFGNKDFQMNYREALEQLSQSYGTYENYARVARDVPRAIRVKSLSWTHHRAVASLKDDAEKVRWLDSAARLGWSTRELEEAIREASPESGRDQKPMLMLRAPADRTELYSRAAQMAGVDSPALWALDVLDREAHAIVGDLAAA